MCIVIKASVEQSSVGGGGWGRWGYVAKTLWVGRERLYSLVTLYPRDREQDTPPPLPLPAAVFLSPLQKQRLARKTTLSKSILRRVSGEKKPITDVGQRKWEGGGTGWDCRFDQG